MISKKNVLVLLASYNGEKYIADQIYSILNQEDVDISILVCDDCSADRTVEVVKNIGSERIQLKNNIVNSGNAALNFLNSLKNIPNDELLSYDYVALADQDDLWLPQKLSKAVSKLEAGNLNLYTSNLTLWNEVNDEKRLLRKDYKQKKYDFLFEGGSAGCTYVLKSSFAIFVKEKIYNLEIDSWKFFSHDWLIYFIARYYNLGVFIDSNSYILYRIHSNNVHGQLNVNSKDSILQRIRLVKDGWYLEQIKGFEKLLDVNSKEKRVYERYKTGIYSRFYLLLGYNFALMRSKKKFVIFFFLSLLLNGTRVRNRN